MGRVEATPENAALRIAQARQIVKDNGRSVFGWEVQSPLYSAFEYLDQTIASLEGDIGKSKLLAKAHETKGDICLTAGLDILQLPQVAARQEYEKAIEVLRATDDVDALEILLEKIAQL